MQSTYVHADTADVELMDEVVAEVINDAVPNKVEEEVAEVNEAVVEEVPEPVEEVPEPVEEIQEEEVEDVKADVDEDVETVPEAVSEITEPTTGSSGSIVSKIKEVTNIANIDVKKVAAFGLGAWGTVTGVGWAMQKMGEKEY
jgi:hypothetical protein